MSNNKQF